MPTPCDPCLARNRVSVGTIKLGEENWCENCFKGIDGELNQCKICGTELAATNVRGFCRSCHSSGADYRYMKGQYGSQETPTTSQNTSLGQKTA